MPCFLFARAHPNRFGGWLDGPGISSRFLLFWLVFSLRYMCITTNTIIHWEQHGIRRTGTIIRRCADLKVQRGALCVCSMKDLFLHGVLALLLLLLACLALPCACLALAYIYPGVSIRLHFFYLSSSAWRQICFHIYYYLFIPGTHGWTCENRRVRS